MYAKSRWNSTSATGIPVGDDELDEAIWQTLEPLVAQGKANAWLRWAAVAKLNWTVLSLVLSSAENLAQEEGWHSLSHANTEGHGVASADCWSIGESISVGNTSRTEPQSPND